MIEREHKAEKISRKIGLASLAGLAALAITGCSGTVVKHTKKEAREIATSRFDKTFEGVSPVGKYMLQFLRVTEVDVATATHGILSGDADTTDYDKFFFGSGCLQNTAYDTAGGEINVHASVNSLFSSASAGASGNVPTAAAYAEVDPKNSNELIIESGHANSVNLKFIGLNSNKSLEPANTQTKNILATYGCNEGISVTSKLVEDSIYGPHTSPYVKK